MIPKSDPKELKEFFRANDFSSAKYYDDHDLSDSDKSEIKEISSVFYNQWESITKEKGLKSNSAYYGNNNPLIQMERCVSNLVSEGVFQLIVEQPEKANAILEQFSDEFYEEEKADKL